MFAASISNIYNRTSSGRFLLLIFIVSLLARIIVPDLKLLHHDEAIHAWNAYNLLKLGIYEYDPMYHGPLLYYLTAGAFSVFGDSDVIVRLLPGIFGSLLIPLVYFVHRMGYLGKNESVIVGLFIAISPDMVYFSRFLRHDIFQLVFTFALLVCILAYLERKGWYYALLAGLMAAFCLCLKEEVPIILLIFGFFFVFMLLAGRIHLPESWKRDIILMIATIAGICSLFYSSLLSHPEMIGKSPVLAVEFWITAHEECRICGPPYYYLSNLVLYELPIGILALIGLYQWMKDGNGNQVFHAISEYFKRLVRKGKLVSRYRGIEDKTRFFTLFAIYWAVSSMILYGIIGEKVPWLLIHQLLPLIFIAVYRMGSWKVVVSLLSCIFLVIMTWHVCFVAEDINEPIVQLQNSEDLRSLFPLIDASEKTVVTKDNYWPLPWYYRGERWNKITLVDFKGKPADVGSLMVLHPDLLIITNGTERNETLSGFSKSQYLMSYSFSWEENRDRLLSYFFFRDGTMKKLILDVYQKSNISTVSPGNAS